MDDLKSDRLSRMMQMRSHHRERKMSHEGTAFELHAKAEQVNLHDVYEKHYTAAGVQGEIRKMGEQPRPGMIARANHMTASKGLKGKADEKV